jgi:Mn2+/Fe2+ NRAMP family transporter
VPHLSASKAFLLLGVALIGTTVSPYMQLYAAAGVVDRGDGPADYRAARLDAISGALFACFIAMTIIIATGAAIGGEGPLQSAKQSAEALRPVAGSAAVALFLGVRLDRDGEEFSRERGAPEPAHGEEIDRPQPGNFGR